MSPLVNEPDEFASEALRGFAASRGDLVTLLDGGLVRASGVKEGHVAVVLGGGSGHFPAFAGWLGPGFGSAAAVGNIFASPSENQVLRAARAAENGGGVIFVPINYAGDILHFGAAAERLAADGARCSAGVAHRGRVGKPQPFDGECIDGQQIALAVFEILIGTQRQPQMIRHVRLAPSPGQPQEDEFLIGHMANLSAKRLTACRSLQAACSR